VPSEHRLKRRVQFYETDAAGIVHFSQYFRYMEEAEHALWRANGLSVAPPGAELGWPRVAASFDYHRPLRFEDEFDVVISVTGRTEKTFKFGCVIEKDGEKVATGSFTVACVRKVTGEPIRSIPIPPEIAERFA
jgi:acyl-CoA thioester hydrolase